MQIIRTVKDMHAQTDLFRRAGKRIAFVPTMGYFHEGHLSLLREGRRRGDCLVVSIFVNPTQFSPGEDLERYPQDFERDLRLARGVGVDVIYAPSVREMYPEGYQTYVHVEEVTQNLCGGCRPCFFRGVTTVCAKLFNAVKPHVTLFGKKDFQQLVAIRTMVRDMNLDLEVVGLPTVREQDGLAMSSRNVYLKPDERKAALSLSRSLGLAQDLYDRGERDAAVLLDRARSLIDRHPEARIDYVKICDVSTMRDIDRLDVPAIMALAVFVGAARLIDNHVFGEPLHLPGSAAQGRDRLREGRDAGDSRSAPAL